MKFLAGILLFSSLTFAGNGEGNGGGAIVCADGTGAITSVQLLDLWEFEKKYPGSIVRTDEPKSLQLQRAIEKLARYDKALARKVSIVLATLESKKEPLDERQGILAPPSDTLIRALRTPRNCPLSGAALYDDAKDMLTIDEEVVGEMGPTDSAALDFHEALYKVQRMGIAKPKNSVSARKITGAIFSNLHNIPDYQNPYHGTNEASFKCESKDSNHKISEQLFIIPLGNGSYRAQITYILGERVFDKTFIDVTNENSKRNLADRMATGFAREQRIATREDLSRRSLNPYVYFYSNQAYGPSLLLTLGVRDGIHLRSCYRRERCMHWIWEKQYTYLNETITLMAKTVEYDHRKGFMLYDLNCSQM